MIGKQPRLIQYEFAGIQIVTAASTSYDGMLGRSRIAHAVAVADGDLRAAAAAARGIGECLRRIGDLTGAHEAFALSARQARASGDVAGEGWTWLTAAGLARQRADFSGAYTLLARARRAGVRAGSLPLIAYAEAGWAETTRIRGQYPQAYREHLRAYLRFQELGDERGYVWALEGVGQMLRHVGLVHDARRHFERARRVAAAIGDGRGFAYALKCHAECLAELGSRDTALGEALHAVELFETLSMTSGRAWALKSLGDIATRARLWAVAFAAFDDAEAVFRSLDDARGIGFARLGRARALASEADGSMARDMLRSAQEAFERAPVLLGLKRVRALARVLQ